MACSDAVKAAAEILYERTDGAGKQTDEVEVPEMNESDREGETASKDPEAEGRQEEDEVTPKRLLTNQKRRKRTRSAQVAKKQRKQ